MTSQIHVFTTSHQKQNNSSWCINPKQHPHRQRWIASLGADALELRPQLPEYLLMLVFQASTNKFIVGRKVHLQLVPYIITKEPSCYQIPQLINDPHSGAIEITAKVSLAKSWSPRFQRVAIDYNAEMSGCKVGIMVPEELTKYGQEIVDQIYVIVKSGRLMLLHDRESPNAVRGVVTQVLGNIAGQRVMPLYVPPYYHDQHFLQYLLNGKRCQIGFPAVFRPSFQHLYELYSPQNDESAVQEPPFLLYTFQRRAYDSAGNQLDRNLGLFTVHVKPIKIFFEVDQKPSNGAPDDPALYDLEDYHHIIICGELHSYSFRNEYDRCAPVDAKEGNDSLLRIFNRIAIVHWRDESGQEHAAIRHIIGDKTPYTGSFPFVED